MCYKTRQSGISFFLARLHKSLCIGSHSSSSLNILHFSHICHVLLRPSSSIVLFYVLHTCIGAHRARWFVSVAIVAIVALLPLLPLLPLLLLPLRHRMLFATFFVNAAAVCVATVRQIVLCSFQSAVCFSIPVWSLAHSSVLCRNFQLYKWLVTCKTNLTWN